MKQMKVKRRLSQTEEFEVMKMVLDKVLWLGFVIMGYGLYLSVSDGFMSGVYYLLAGAVVLVIFARIIVKEFEQIR